MVYNIVYKKKFDKEVELVAGEKQSLNINKKLNDGFNYKIRLKGELAIPYTNRVEEIYPVYLRKLEDSLQKTNNEYVLKFGDFNYEYERSCYYMCRGDFKLNYPYIFSVKYKSTGANDNLKLSLEVYYGEQKTRYYYQSPDCKYEITLNDSENFTIKSQEITLNKKVDFFMVKISGIDFNGNATVFTPSFTDGQVEYIEKFSYAPDTLLGLKWIGEGFSVSLRPYYKVVVNNKKIFEGRKYERQHRWSGVEFEIPDGLLKGNDKIEIYYSKNNRYAYRYKEMQIISLPKTSEILGVSHYQTVNQPFGVLCYFDRDTKVSFLDNDFIEILDNKIYNKGYGVIKFLPKRSGKNIKFKIKLNEKSLALSLKEIFDKTPDNILTGCGDFIYLNQNVKDFVEYIGWYLNEDIGNMVTLRSCFRWGTTSELNEDFWIFAKNILCDLGLYYCLMTDGRELNGVNANPSKELLDSKYFLGEQTHERDGAYTYWTQEIDESETLFYHLLSRKLERNGIYGKKSPVYDSKGQAYIYYTGEGVDNVKTAYDNLFKMLQSTCQDGATRHTGTTPLFDVFLKSGYKWVGYESLYGPHELMFGAIRGISEARGVKDYGAHIALQWSTVPAYDLAHALRYKISLYLSYMHGANWINTEEGLWNIENLFIGADRFTNTSRIHKKAQQELYRFISTRKRVGTIKRDIAMVVGKYDGMDCFSSGRVFGQRGEEWKYNKPEKSWELLKVFYPKAKIGAVYCCVYKGGKKKLVKDNKELYDTLTGRYSQINDYKSLGLFSETPYGPIDIITEDVKDYSRYKFIFFAGWNTCTEKTLKKLCDYMKNGGIVMMSKVHLYKNIKRKEVFDGKGIVLRSPYVKKLLQYREKGNLIYFDKDKYPIDIKDYKRQLKRIGQKYKSNVVYKTKNVSFVEYDKKDGGKDIYLININWWNKQKAKAIIQLFDKRYKLSLNDNDIHVLEIGKDGKAVLKNKENKIEKIINN